MVDAVALSKCRNEESFNLLLSRAFIMAEANPTISPAAKRLKQMMKLQNRTLEDHYPVTCYDTSTDKVVAEIRSRFDGHDQDVLSGLADIVFNRSPVNASIELVSQIYDVGSDLLRSEKAIFEEINANHAYAQTKNLL